MNLYFDNAATTYPKPNSVYDSVFNFMNYNGASPGRGAYSSALEADRMVFSLRELLCDFFDFNYPDHVILSPSITYSLNTVIQTSIKRGWQVLTTSMEHNSVLRPLYELKKELDFDIKVLDCTKEGFLQTETLLNSISSNTKLLIMSTASNVVGTKQDILSIGKICKYNNIDLILDTAQSAGAEPLSFKELNCSVLAFTGHKSLLGPQGTGGFLISPDFAVKLSSLIQGGTGSESFNIYQPDILPDKFESGTFNTPGFAGLKAGIEFINNEGINTVFEKESFLTHQFIDMASKLPNVKIYGSFPRSSTVSVNMDGIDPSILAFYLSRDFNICTRCGLHCAPLAHRTISTFPQGTVRFSFGYFNNLKDIEYAVESLFKISKYTM